MELSNNNHSIFLAGETLALMKFSTVNTKKEIQYTVHHTSTINCIAIDRRDKYVFTGSNDKTIKQWDVLRNGLIRDFRITSGDTEIMSLVCTKKSALISGSSSGLLRRYDIKKIDKLPKDQIAQFEIELKITSDAISVIETLGDEFIIVGKVGGTVLKHSAINLQKECKYSHVHQGAVTSILINKTFATSGKDGKVNVLQYA